MRVYHLKPPVKSLGWLVGLSFFLLATLFPPLPVATLYTIGNSINREFGAWVYTFFYTGAFGGLAWRLQAYLQWQTFARSPLTGRLLFTQFAPYAFVPVTLTISTLIVWRWLVYRAQRPTVFVLRGLWAVVLAFAFSLLLVYLLDEVGGHLLLSALSLSGRGNLEVEGLLTSIWATALAQSAWFFLPCLVIGELLAWWQENLWLKFMRRLQPWDERWS